MTLPLLSRFVIVPALRPVSEPPVSPVQRNRRSRVPPEAPCDRERFAYLRKSHD